MMIYAWNLQPANSATIKIVTLHFQSLLIFVVGGMEWDSITSKFIHTSSSSFNFSLSAIECLFPHWNLLGSLLVAVMLPFGAGIFALAAGVVVWCWRSLVIHIRKRGKRSSVDVQPAKTEKRGRWIKVAKTFANLLDLLYFPVALMTFQMLGCTSSSAGWLNKFPAMKWVRVGGR